MTTWWLIHVTLPGMIALVAFLALYFGIGTVWISFLLRSICMEEDKPISNVLVAVCAATGWVTLEWIRGHFLFGGFPWNFLGVTQSRSIPLIQFATVTGVYGVSALICFVNLCFYRTLRRFIKHAREGGPRLRLSWEFYLAMGLLCSALLGGIQSVLKRSTDSITNLRVSLVQGNIPQSLKYEPEQKPMILDRYETLTRTAIIGEPELIIWPETASPDPIRFDIESYSLATNLVAIANASVLVGSIDWSAPPAPAEPFNAAVLFHPEYRPLQIYRKMHLVPFGEYVPLGNIFPFFQWLTPIEGSFKQGNEYTMFDLKNTTFGTVICFEDTVANLYRKFVKQGADFMVNLTNDAWFKKSPEAEIHLANSIFRAVENRRPLIRSTNHGITCVIDKFGFVRTRLAPFQEGIINAEVEINTFEEQTFYTMHGDVFVGLCAAITTLVFIRLFLKMKRQIKVF